MKLSLSMSMSLQFSRFYWSSHINCDHETRQSQDADLLLGQVSEQHDGVLAQNGRHG